MQAFDIKVEKGVHQVLLKQADDVGGEKIIGIHSDQLEQVIEWMRKVNQEPVN